VERHTNDACLFAPSESSYVLSYASYLGGSGLSPIGRSGGTYTATQALTLDL
jgi:hypothetical protein